MRRDISDDHCIVIMDQIHNCIKSLTIVNNIADLIFILSGADLLHQMKNWPFSVDQQHSSLREQATVDKLKPKRPNYCNDHLRKKYPAHDRRGMKFLVKQCNLKVCNHIHDKQGKDL